MEPRITMITLGVNDLKRSYEFYSKIIGFPSKNGIENDAVVFFNLNHMLLSLYPKSLLAEDAGVPDDGRGFPGFTLAYNVKNREDVDEIIHHLRIAGAVISKEPQETFWGGYDAYFQDLDGYSWEIAWNPYMWVE
ncbi:MAG: glyoxalase [Anaerolineales bacterium]|nr:VOC family protein [Anaerolineae bacterium]PWB56882.1 MAG: glyoxalase [Anaerolineales bacterium]